MKFDVESDLKSTSILFAFRFSSTGEHKIYLKWSDFELPRSPVRAHAVPATLPVDHHRVKVTGQGLTEAVVKEEAEFIIDGRTAGPGKHGGGA